MKVSTEWRGHAHDLRRIAEMLKDRPTLDVEGQRAALQDMADQIEADAADYEAEEEADAVA